MRLNLDRRTITFLAAFVALSLLVAACNPESLRGAAGPPGPQGPAGEPGVGLTDEQAAQLASAAALAEMIPLPALEAVSRGCPRCHSLVGDDGKFTLAYEAIDRTAARGETHPEVAPDGTSLAPTEEVRVATCLLCHASGSGAREGLGVGAPLSLRDIVHPAHMFSQAFKLYYGGDCFTCHNVAGNGDFDLLTEAVEVNDKGVPNPDKLPIPGAIGPTEQ